MIPKTSQGPFCQSCSMPLGKPEDFGTFANGIRNNEYCVHCYKDGQFTEPRITQQQMIDRGVAIMAREGIMPESDARALLVDTMPLLKRWRVTVPAASHANHDASREAPF